MILYLGNKKSPTLSTIDTLGEQLKDSYEIKTVSEVPNKILRFLDMMKEIIKHRHDCELMIVDTYSTWNFYYAMMTAFFAKRFGIPYIPILHGGNLPDRLDKDERLSNYLFKDSYANVTPSIYLKEAFEKRGYKTTHIKNNIELDMYEFKLRENIAPKLLYVRSFAEIYNTKMAIRAFEMVLKKYPEATLTMIGPDRDGSLEKTREYAKELGVGDSVVFTGGMNKEEWIELSSESDIFINPTNFDNLPVSIVEAMALGFVIVSTNVGGLPYLIENEKDGLLVDKNDHIAMGNKILRLLKEPQLCKKLSTNARKKAQTYAWSEVKKDWDRVIKGAIKDA
jgi:glycosyltransferase involved in cell wall biosynthesis